MINTFSHKMGGINSPPEKIIKWIKFLTAILLIVIFIKIAPLTETIPIISNDFTTIKERGIQTGLFWWADVHEVAEAERYFKKLDLLNKGPSKVVEDKSINSNKN